jgi:hypothetical protein
LDDEHSTAQDKPRGKEREKWYDRTKEQHDDSRHSHDDSQLAREGKNKQRKKKGDEQEEKFSVEFLKDYLSPAGCTITQYPHNQQDNPPGIPLQRVEIKGKEPGQ